MEKSFFMLLFLSETIRLVQPVTRNFYLILQQKSWTEAQTHCRTYHTDLATLEGPEDVTKLQDEAQKQHFTSDAWIGLYKEVSDWRWSFGNQPIGTFLHWEKDEPNNYAGKQECVMINSPGWSDKSCKEKFNFICFDEGKTGSERYTLYSVNNTWYEAQSYCRQHHTDLANTLNQSEYSSIIEMITTNTWFGLYRNSWRWSDQTITSTIPWAPECPFNVWRNGNYGFIHKGLVADNSTNLNQMPFYCHRVTMALQMIRVKILSDHNVNDQAVTTSIVETVKAKLKDHGMDQNIKVSWREQPGGEVLKKIK